uniref:RNase H type-1 domain-containing protein n=1 Tax=Aegilops tauschii TaxID=37682 RepID=M8BH45_AEGTA
MPDRDLVAWGVMLDSYCQTQDYREALLLLNKLKRSRIVPDQVILATVLSACGHTRHLRSGKVIHSYILVSDIFIDARLSSALLNMYATCADMEMAKKLYSGMQRKDLISSTVMVCGYAKNGKIDIARSIFNCMMEKDVVSWSAMISGYAENNQPSEALILFKDMQECGVCPDEITLLSVISACANICSLDKARWIHSFVVNNGFCKILSICNALINMFSKCGSLTLALNVFNAMPRKNVITWTSMISAFARHGDGKSALALFDKMKSEGVEPNGVTFLGLLFACCHAGLVDEGRSLFECMVQEYRIEPKLEHYGCMVDLMGKAKLLQEAVDLIKSMHVRPNVAVWGSLLAACWMHGDLELGAFSARKILELDPNHNGAYVFLSNMHAKSGNWNNAREVRGVIEGHRVSKETSCSRVELNGIVHDFGAEGLFGERKQIALGVCHRPGELLCGEEMALSWVYETSVQQLLDNEQIEQQPSSLSCREDVWSADCGNDNESLFHSLGFLKVQIETGCLAVLTMWHSGSRVRNLRGFVIQEMKEYAEAFQEFESIFARREANQAAHPRAKELLSI